jgi:C-terminal domain found in long catalases
LVKVPESRRSAVSRRSLISNRAPNAVCAESFADHYSQARQFFISQTMGEQTHIAAAAETMDDLLQESAARDFVADAYVHCKFIGYVEPALPLFEKEGVATDDFDEGCIAIASAKDVRSFVEGLAKLRIWGREPNVKLP